MIDLGINRPAGGSLRGDLNFEGARRRVAWITPVPGGVGPMTMATHLENTVDAAEGLYYKQAARDMFNQLF